MHEMPKFLAVHPLAAPTSVEETAPLAKKIKASCTVNAYWIQSWAQLNAEGKAVKVLCQWDAVNARAIQQVLAKFPELPTEGVYPMMIINAEDFR